MNNIFGINVTNNKDNTDYDGDIFIRRRVSEETVKQLDAAFNANQQLQKKASIPTWLEIIKLIFMFLAIIITLGILKSDVSLRQGFENAWYLYITGIISLIGFIGLSIYGRRKEKKVIESEELTENIRSSNEIAAAAMQELKFPLEPQSLDVIADKYKIKNDEKKQINFNTYFANVNLDLYVFIEDVNLCLADLYKVYEIPLSSITSMELSKKKASLPFWNKDEEYNSEKYKQFKVVLNSQGTYFTKYYKVNIRDTSGDFVLLIPNYDQPLFSELTGVNPE